VGRWFRTPRAGALAALLACAAGLLAGSAPASAESFGVAKFEAGTCNSDGPPLQECSYTAPESQFYTQAAGHPPLGITGFEVNTEPLLLGRKPIGNVRDVRVDIPPGLSVNPDATCSTEELQTSTCAGKGQCTPEQFEANGCPAQSLVGEDEIDGFVVAVGLEHVKVPMYNLVPPPGVPAEFGLNVKLGPVEVKILIVGGISWYKEAPTSENSGVPTGDYHEYFTIKGIPDTIEVVKTRLKFTGTAGDGTFITLPSVCATQTSYLHVDSYEHPGQFLSYQTLSGYPPKAIGVSGCDKVPFTSSVRMAPADTQSDRVDGPTVEVQVPQSKSASSLDNSTVRDAYVALPEGLTLNPAAANGLEACSDAQFGEGTNAPIACPAGSVLGTVAIEAPQLPPGSLSGNVYVGQPLSDAPESGQEYRIFIAAESARYGAGVRLTGRVYANAATGRLTTAVLEAPQLPFSDFILNFNSAHNPLANPLACGPATTNSNLVPYSGNPAAEPFSAFVVDFDGKGAACPPLPFALTQSATTIPTTGGASTSIAFGLTRGEGRQYLSRVSTVLPPGLVGKIPAVSLCGEPQAAAGTCSSASQIGTVAVTLGSGPTPLSLGGVAYLTTSYGGAPYGLSVVVPAEKIGPYDYGRIVTRAAINVDPHTARIIVTSRLPTIVGGAPLRLRSLSVSVNHPNFTINPTNCSPLTTDTTLTSTFGAVQTVSSPFQATGCSALPFAPKLTASTNAKTSKADGAILVVKVAYPAGAQANIKSVYMALPKQLPSRISTLNKACPAATFEANPAACPPLSRVGTATVSTPVLPGKLTGPAMFVSHGGAAFPDLDLVLSGDGVTVILVGNTNIAKGITSSTYASVPDVPVSSFEARLPRGPDSALGAVGSLCKKSLHMPTTITAQNGKLIKQSTKIAVGDCPVVVLSHRVRGHEAILVVKVPAAGRLSVTGKGLAARRKRPGKARDLTIAVPLSRGGLRALASSPHRRLAVKVRLRFVPKAKKLPKSAASTTVVFK
jgi:hypothetical protein